MRERWRSRCVAQLISGLAFLLLLLPALAVSLAAAELRSFSTTDVNGVQLDLATLDDQFVVVNFWATWCKPCRKEIPDLSELHTRRADITVLGLAFEEASPEQIVEFLQVIPASYPVALVDVYNPPQQFGTPRVWPTTLVISPAGVLLKKFVGPVTGAQIEAVIDGHEP